MSDHASLHVPLVRLGSPELQLLGCSCGFRCVTQNPDDELARHVAVATVMLTNRSPRTTRPCSSCGIAISVPIADVVEIGGVESWPVCRACDAAEFGDDAGDADDEATAVDLLVAVSAAGAAAPKLAAGIAATMIGMFASQGTQAESMQRIGTQLLAEHAFDLGSQIKPSKESP